MKLVAYSRMHEKLSHMVGAQKTYPGKFSRSRVFDLWCKAYNKTYPSEEEMLHRFKVSSDFLGYVLPETGPWCITMEKEQKRLQKEQTGCKKSKRGWKITNRGYEKRNIGWEKSNRGYKKEHERLEKEQQRLQKNCCKGFSKTQQGKKKELERLQK